MFSNLMWRHKRSICSESLEEVFTTTTSREWLFLLGRSCRWWSLNCSWASLNAAADQFSQRCKLRSIFWFITRQTRDSDSKCAGIILSLFTLKIDIIFVLWNGGSYNRHCSIIHMDQWIRDICICKYLKYPCVNNYSKPCLSMIILILFI